MNRKRRFPVVIAAVVSALLLALVIYVHGIRRVDPHALDRTITQQLSTGSDQAQVIAFLDSNGISHSGYMPEHHVIQATIEKSRIGLGGGRLIIHFYFDDQRRLVGHRVYEKLNFL